MVYHLCILETTIKLFYVTDGILYSIATLHVFFCILQHYKYSLLNYNTTSILFSTTTLQILSTLPQRCKVYATPVPTFSQLAYTLQGYKEECIKLQTN
jgi:hypothetical protein